MPRFNTYLFVLPVLVFGLGGFASGDDPKPKPTEEPKLEMSQDEKTLLELTNKERAKENLTPLEPQKQLFEAARGHSANMAKQEELNHILDEKGPGQRVDSTGYKWMGVGENIASSDGETLAGIMKQWMESKLHRANILNKDFRQIGLGIAKNDKGETYYTQVFATPLKK